MGDSKPHKAGFDIDIIDLSEFTSSTKKDIPENKDTEVKKDDPEKKEVQVKNDAPVNKEKDTPIKEPVIETEQIKQEAVVEKLPDTNIKPKYVSEERKGKIIDAIFAKMKKRGNFPSFTQQIASVNKILKLKYASAKDIADVIGKDLALTQKLLHLVNSSFYGQFSKKGLSSITQAMIILGADCIQQMAASLMLFEMMQATSKTDELKDMTIGNFVSGIIAKDLAQAKGYSDTETFLICSMFHNIGEYMIIFYFPENYEKVNNLLTQKNMNKETASRTVLGVTYQELGIGIGSKWNLPDYILDSMKPIPKKNSNKITTAKDMLRCVSSFSNDICQVAMLPEDAPNPKSLGDVIGQYKDIIDISTKEIEDVLDSVAEKIHEHATNLKINVKNSRLLQNISAQNIKKQYVVNTQETTRKKAQREFTIPEKMKQIKQILKTDYNIGDVLNKILDIMFNDFNYKRVAMGIKTMDGNQIIVRYVLGDNSENFKKNFQFKMTKSKDVFNASLKDEIDTIVPDVNSQKNVDIVPKWFKAMECAQGFALYPIIVDNIPFGVFYVDSESTKLNDYVKYHGDMKRLRTLAVKAIKLKSG